MPNRVAAYFLFVLGVVTITFFRHYTGNLIPYPWIFLLLGIAMFIAGYFLLRYSTTTAGKGNQRRLLQFITELKTNGEKIPVDFTRCDIRGHSYQEARPGHGADSQLVELTVSPVFHQLMNHLDDPGGSGMQDVRQSVFVFSYLNPRTGATEKFRSPIIPKDEITLSFYLDRQKQTTLYVDRSNRNQYYFDLDFLQD